MGNRLESGRSITTILRANPSAKFFYDTAVAAKSAQYQALDGHREDFLRANCREVVAVRLLTKFFPVDRDGIRMELPSTENNRLARAIWARAVDRETRAKLNEPHVEKILALHDQIKNENINIGRRVQQYTNYRKGEVLVFDPMIELTLFEEKRIKNELLQESGLSLKQK